MYHVSAPGMEPSDSRARPHRKGCCFGYWAADPVSRCGPDFIGHGFLLVHSRVPSSLVLQEDGVNTCIPRSWEQAWPLSQPEPHHARIGDTGPFEVGTRKLVIYLQGRIKKKRIKTNLALPFCCVAISFEDQERGKVHIMSGVPLS